MKHVNNGKGNSNGSVKIESHVTHKRFHGDEGASMWSAVRFGERYFPGSSTANFIFLEHDLTEGWTKDSHMYHGIGGTHRRPRGIVVDEHTPEGRLEDSCAFKIIVSRLHIGGKPRMHDLVREILINDSKAKTFTTQLSGMINIMHRVKRGGGQHGTLMWTFDALDAIFFGRKDEDIDVVAEWHKYREDKGVSESETSADMKEQVKAESRNAAIAHVTKILEASADRVSRHVNADGTGRFLTEIANIACRLSPALRYKWLGKAFETLLEDAMLYQEALNLTFDQHEVVTTAGKRILSVFKTDNEHAATAARSQYFGKAAIVVIRNGKGHTMVSANPDLPDAKVEDLATLIRMAEFKKATGRCLPYALAQGMGTLKDVPEWYLAFPNLLLNNSLTHTSSPNSRLTPEEIAEIAADGFTADGIEMWCDRYFGGSVRGSGIPAAKMRKVKDAEAIAKQEQLEDEKSLRSQYAEASHTPSAASVAALDQMADGVMPADMEVLESAESAEGKPSGIAAAVVSTAPAPEPEVPQAKIQE